MLLKRFDLDGHRISFRVGLPLECLNDGCIVAVAIFCASRNFMVDDLEIFDF